MPGSTLTGIQPLAYQDKHNVGNAGWGPDWRPEGSRGPHYAVKRHAQHEVQARTASAQHACPAVCDSRGQQDVPLGHLSWCGDLVLQAASSTSRNATADTLGFFSTQTLAKTNPLLCSGRVQVCPIERRLKYHPRLFVAFSLSKAVICSLLLIKTKKYLHGIPGESCCAQSSADALDSADGHGCSSMLNGYNLPQNVQPHSLVV